MSADWAFLLYSIAGLFFVWWIAERITKLIYRVLGIEWPVDKFDK